MIKIGLTGNRYSGKDTVGRLFEQISIPVFNADVILKFILNHNFEVLYNIKKHIGTGIFKNDDQYDINTIKLMGGFGKILDEAEFELLKAYEKFRLKNNQSIYTIFQSSIIFESTLNKNMDYIITVFSPEKERIDRCKYSPDTTGLQFNGDIMEIHNLISTEMPDLEKNRMSDYVIHNYDGILPDLSTQVQKIDQKIIDKYLTADHRNY